jgi:Asp-tRNA(Asn)/Glu-tRNA(Gln) amidotransferase B subunit
MPKTPKKSDAERQYGPAPIYGVARNKTRISIVVTQAMLDAAKEVARSQKPPQTVSNWGLHVILAALEKEGYKKW